MEIKVEFTHDGKLVSIGTGAQFGVPDWVPLKCQLVHLATSSSKQLWGRNGVVYQEHYWGGLVRTSYTK